MEFFTPTQRKRLLENGKSAQRPLAERLALKPVVRLYNSLSGVAWLMTELDPCNPDEGFGLVEFSTGDRQLSPIRMSELQSIDGRFGNQVHRDPHFRGKKALRAYLDEAEAERAKDVRLPKSV